MNDDKNNALYEKYKSLADKESNVIFGGRLGMYKYFDMHNVIDEALKCVEITSRRIKCYKLKNLQFKIYACCI